MSAKRNIPDFAGTADGLEWMTSDGWDGYDRRTDTADETVKRNPVTRFYVAPPRRKVKHRRLYSGA